MGYVLGDESMDGLTDRVKIRALVLEDVKLDFFFRVVGKGPVGLASRLGVGTVDDFFLDSG